MTREEINAHIGARIRVRRRRLELTQDALVKIGAVASVGQLSRLENGKQEITKPILDSISLGLNAPVDYFLEGLPEGSFQGEISLGHKPVQKATIAKRPPAKDELNPSNVHLTTRAPKDSVFCPRCEKPGLIPLSYAVDRGLCGQGQTLTFVHRSEGTRIDIIEKHIDEFKQDINPLGAILVLSLILPIILLSYNQGAIAAVIFISGFVLLIAVFLRGNAALKMKMAARAKNLRGIKFCKSCKHVFD